MSALSSIPFSTPQGKQLLAAIGTLALILCAVLLLRWAHHRHWQRSVLGVQVRFLQARPVFFLSEEEVINLMDEALGMPALGQPLAQLRMRQLEKALLASPYAQQAQVWHDVAGHLHTSMHQVQPMARLHWGTGPDAYLSPEGKLAPPSNNFTDRVLLVTGEGLRELTFEAERKTKEEELLALLNYIAKDPFWKDMVAEVEVDEKQEITLYPQLGSQVIQFGSIQHYPLKFKKLEAFYRQIIPARGWNAFHTVSVKYKNQIICE